MKRTIVAITLATAWIIFSEFIRNEFWLKPYWSDHYQSLGIVFPSASVNGAIWGVWSLVFAACIFLISTRANFGRTFFISWLMGFLMMWLVIGNLGVLPYGILPYAIPLSMVEVLVATWIIFKFK